MLGGHRVNGGVALLAVVGGIDILATRDEEAVEIGTERDLAGAGIDRTIRPSRLFVAEQTLRLWWLRPSGLRGRWRGCR